MDDLLIRRVINDALSKLKRSTPPDCKRPRTSEELREFLEQVKSELQRFNIPVPGTEIDMPSTPPKGMAWAVKVAMVNEDQDFFAFAKKHGQMNVWLAAIALSSPEHDDHGEIRALKASLEILKELAVSTRQSLNGRNPKSAFRALVLSVLKKNPNDTAEEIWERLQGLHGRDLEPEFNGKSVTVDLDFIIIGCTKEEMRMRSYVEWNVGADEPTRFKRSSLDKMINELRSGHGLFKCI